MKNRFLRALAQALLDCKTTQDLDDDALSHEALHGDSAIIELVCELRSLELAQGHNSATSC